MTVHGKPGCWTCDTATISPSRRRAYRVGKPPWHFEPRKTARHSTASRVNCDVPSYIRWQPCRYAPRKKLRGSDRADTCVEKKSVAAPAGPSPGASSPLPATVLTGARAHRCAYTLAIHRCVASGIAAAVQFRVTLRLSSLSTVRCAHCTLTSSGTATRSAVVCQLRAEQREPHRAGCERITRAGRTPGAGKTPRAVRRRYANPSVQGKY